MNKKEFNEKVLAPIEEYANLGETINDMGARLIGHVPHIAPKAYVHVVYTPLDNNYFHEMEERLQRPIPFQYKDFLTYANGLNLFSDAFRVNGYVPINKKAGSGVYDYPPCVITPNVSGRIKGLRPKDLVIAWYKCDGSYVLLNEKGTAIRFDAQGDGADIQEWQDFDAWLYSEISTLDKAYKEGDIAVFVPSKYAQK